jgi:hypothetical protein
VVSLRDVPPIERFAVPLQPQSRHRPRKEIVPAAEDAPDPVDPTGPDIVYAERVCRVCSSPLTDRQGCRSDGWRKRYARARGPA